MKKKIHKILGVSLALVFAFTLTFAFSAPAMADEEEWDDFSIPTESIAGALGDAFMGNAIGAMPVFEQAIDGTMYIYVGGAAPFVDLFSSDDEGRTWSATDYAADIGAFAILAMATYSEDADVLYVAVRETVVPEDQVWMTDDAGDSWTNLGCPAGLTTVGITCIDVGFADDDPHIFVGYDLDNDADGDGEVWYYRDAPFAAVWTDLDVCGPDSALAINNSDVYGIACSPDFENDVLAVAVIADNTGAANSYVVANEGAGIGATVWDDLEILDDDDVGFIITEATDPVFVEDFEIDDDYELFIGVTAGDFDGDGDVDGGIYRITGMTNADDFLLEVGDTTEADIASLDLVGDLGSASLVAGEAAGAGPADIFYSTDDGDDWDACDKLPVGRGATANLVLVSDDFADSGVAWCAANAATNEGGVHLTTDFGATWNGISLLDTDMDGPIRDVALTADYGEGDAPLFMVTEASAGAGRDHSVWKYDGTNWERVLNELQAGNNIDLVAVSPHYADDTAVFVANSAAPTIFYSHDGGAEFTEMIRQPDDAISAWLVIDDETVITADDGSTTAGDVYKTTRYGRRVWDAITTGAGVITDLAMSPNYASDGTILAGDVASLVCISTDEGEEWDEVSDSDLAGIVGAVGDTYVAFDADYANNDTFYAASDDAVGRCEVDAEEDPGDQAFDNMNVDDFVADFAAASGLVCSADGTLYAADATAVVIGAVDAVVAADADAFTITDATGVGGGGNIVVLTGSVTITGNSATTTPTLVAGPQVVAAGAIFAYVVGAVATDAVTVTAGFANTSGTWTAAAAVTGGITVDADGDATVVAAGGIFSLPDTGVVAVAAGEAAGGVARSLNPTDAQADIEWELPQAGLAAGMTFGGIGAGGTTPNTVSTLKLSYGSNILYTVDTAAAINLVWEYEDTLAAPVVLMSPADGTTGAGTDEVTFEWDDLNADTVVTYRLRLNEKEDFSGPELGEAVDIENDTTFTVYDLDSGTTYYWKVKVTDPVASRYSEVFSFQTKVGQVTAPVEVRPLPGAQDVILSPTFAWRAADGVDYYEVDVATDTDFTSIVTSGTPEANTWAIDVALDYSTVYYWRVRGIAPTGIPEASYIISIFTTMEKPEAAAPPVKVEQAAPAPDIIVEVPAPVEAIPSWMALTIIIIGAVLVIALVVLIVRTRRVV